MRWVLLCCVLALGCGDGKGDTDASVGDDDDVVGDDDDILGDDDDDATTTDADGDGFGPDEDCNDNNPAINPQATDIVGDGIDQNCDDIDGTDQDGDGFASVASGGDDCNDADPDTYAAAVDSVGDGIDNNCDGVDGEDGDEDGFASSGSGGTDCDDNDPNINPDSEDSVGDGVDNNCDLLDGVDADGDGYADLASGGEDCDDGNAAANPAALEVFYDGLDQDCDGACDYDADGDEFLLVGHVPLDGDACDFDPSPGQVQILEDCDDDDVYVGANSIVDQFPIDGEVGAFYRTSVETVLQVEDLSATITLADGAGLAVPGVVSISGARVVFVPDNPLAPSADYDVEVTWGCGQEAWSFQTSDVGAPTDVLAVLGSTYSLDLASGRFVEPAGVGPLIQQQLDADMLVKFVQLQPVLDTLMAMSGTGAQDMCMATNVFPPGTFALDPYFSIGPADVSLDIQGIEILWEDMVLTGAFSPDGSSVEGVVLIATQDTRPLVDLIGGYGDDAVCDLVAAFGVSCTTCPSDGLPYCLTTYVDSMAGTLEPGIDLIPITQFDIDNNPSCL